LSLNEIFGSARITHPSGSARKPSSGQPHKQITTKTDSLHNLQFMIEIINLRISPVNAVVMVVGHQNRLIARRLAVEEVDFQKKKNGQRAPSGSIENWNLGKNSSQVPSLGE
jgi:hypothetical protein